MTFNSYQFFIFLPLVLLFYFIIPGKWRTAWLLLVSYLFYFRFHPKYVFVLLAVTAVSYAAGLRMEKTTEESRASREEGLAEGGGKRRMEEAARKKRIALWTGVGISLAVLVIFKYTDFILENINGVLGLAGREPVSLPFSLVMPVGISYFTFQIISYLSDIYYGKASAEKNFLVYALYVSFFPKIISGPIERAEDFLVQIRDCRNWKLWDGGRVRDGLVLMMWGYFEKLVIADRLAILTEKVFGDYASYGSVELFIAAAAFYIQLYTDFDGCINMARGMAKVMGFTLAENFNAPFFAKNIRDYWSRWHISLSLWLRDYIYIPLGGNRRGTFCKYRNLLLTFLVSGIWHGAAWNYVFWGLLHGIYEVLGLAAAPFIEKINNKLHTRTQTFSYRLMQTVKCWLLVCFAYIFFKVPTAADGLRYLKRMLTKWNPWALFDGSLYTLGISEKYFHFLIWAVILLLLVDWLKYKKHMEIDEWLGTQCIWFRFAAMLGCIMAVIIFGAYGPAYEAGNFIYFQF
ncbi:MAG: MBOAT family protein [Lachnospiraceae bacterium]|nr:MBOAT family protein [Lachnospiraceae bacterium]